MIFIIFAMVVVRIPDLRWCGWSRAGLRSTAELRVPKVSLQKFAQQMMILRAEVPPLFGPAPFLLAFACLPNLPIFVDDERMSLEIGGHASNAFKLSSEWQLVSALISLHSPHDVRKVCDGKLRKRGLNQFPVMAEHVWKDLLEAEVEAENEPNEAEQKPNDSGGAKIDVLKEGRGGKGSERPRGVLRDPHSKAYVKKFFISVTEEEFCRGLLWVSEQDQVVPAFYCNGRDLFLLAL
jgi:hypothetical protein